MTFENNSSLVQERKFRFAHPLEKISLTFHGTSADSWTPKNLIVYKKFVFLLTLSKPKANCMYNQKNYPLTSPKEKIICLTTKIFDCLQKINLSLHLYMGIRKASYNRISKSSFTSPRENIKRLSGIFFIPSLVQRKKSYSWAPEILIVYKKLIYPFTYTREFTRHPTTKFQKVSSLFKPKNQRHYARAQQKIFIPLLIQGKNRVPLCAEK